MEDRCIMCGEVIPEGRMVCPSCEKNALNQELDEEIETTNITTQPHAKRHITTKNAFSFRNG